MLLQSENRPHVFGKGPYKEDVFLNLVTPADVEAHGGFLRLNKGLEPLVKDLLHPWLKHPGLDAKASQDRYSN